MKKRTFCISIIFSIITSLLHAQHAIGSWQNYLSYHNVTHTEAAGNIIYAIGNGSLFSYDKEDTSIQCYWKDYLLNDSEISHISYSKDFKTLIIIYSNANIDFLINDTDVYNLPDYMNKNMTQTKTVNHIFLAKEYAYLSTSFGIIVLNVKKKEISNTYILNKHINACAVDDNKIYAASPDGLLTGNLTDNLLDASNWNEVNSTTYSSLSMYNDNLLGTIPANGIYHINKSDYSSLLLINGNYEFMNIYNDKLLAGNNNLLTVFDDINNHYTINHNLNVAHFSYENGIYWAGAYDNGIIGIKHNATTNIVETVVSSIIPDSPKRNYPYFMKFEGDRLLITGGGITNTVLNREGTIMVLENNTWSYFQEDGIREITGLPYKNITSIAEDPMDEKHYFASSATEGLYEFYDKKFIKLYSLDNSPLQSSLSNDKNFVRVNGLIYDNNMNLWMLNCTSDKHIHILKKDGQWKSFHFPEILSPPTNFEHTIIDRRGWLWAASTYFSRSGIFCLNTNGTIDDPGEFNHRFFSSFTNQDGSILNYRVYSLVEDREGAIWIGTDHGPIILNNPSNAFENNFTCTQIKVPRNDGTNLADFLLANDIIKVIAIDGANRKWVGTAMNGLYLLSPDGLETIHHFTEDNSPLLSNSITSLAIHPRTGEVFIGTSKGLLSYQSDAIEPKDNFVKEDVYAYPNPVKPDYTGVITVTGLVEDTDVKITNANGKLIYSGTSVGGQFTWNGRNMQNNRVPSGIYFVLAADKEGKQGIATKILIIK